MDERARIVRWLVETVKALGAAAVGAVMVAAVSCQTLPGLDALGGLTGGEPDRPATPALDYQLIVRMEAMIEQLECPVDTAITRRYIEDLETLVRDERAECVELLDAERARADAAEARAAEAEARAEQAEADLAAIRSLLQPADKAEGETQ